MKIFRVTVQMGKKLGKVLEPAAVSEVFGSAVQE